MQPVAQNLQGFQIKGEQLLYLQIFKPYFSSLYIKLRWIAFKTKVEIEFLSPVIIFYRDKPNNEPTSFGKFTFVYLC